MLDGVTKFVCCRCCFAPRLLCEVLRFIEGAESTPSPELLSAASHLARCDPASFMAWEILQHTNSDCGDQELERLRQLRSNIQVNARSDASEIEDQVDSTPG